MQAPQNQNIRMSSGPICGGALPRPMSHQHQEAEPSSSDHMLGPVSNPLLEENHRSLVEKARGVPLVTVLFPGSGLLILNRRVPGDTGYIWLWGLSLNTATKTFLLLPFCLHSVLSMQDNSILDYRRYVKECNVLVCKWSWASSSVELRSSGTQ
jgi:hypothetical protein